MERTYAIYQKGIGNAANVGFTVKPQKTLSLEDREKNYAIIEKETLDIVFALHKFAKYLLM